MFALYGCVTVYRVCVHNKGSRMLKYLYLLLQYVGLMRNPEFLMNSILLKMSGCSGTGRWQCYLAWSTCQFFLFNISIIETVSCNYWFLIVLWQIWPLFGKHLEWCQVSFFCSYHMQILWNSNNTTLYWALDYVGLDDELSSHPTGLRASLWRPERLLLMFELDICFGVSSRRPRETNVKNKNRMVSERPKAGWLKSPHTEFCFVDTKMYMYISFSFASFDYYYMLLPLIIKWLYSGVDCFRREEETRTDIYIFTVWQLKNDISIFGGSQVHQLKPNPQFWHLCAWERLYTSCTYFPACVQWLQEKLHCWIYS